jgi:hypothetical protein
MRFIKGLTEEVVLANTPLRKEEEKGKKLSRDGKKIKDILERSPFSNRQTLADLMSVVIGEEITIKKRTPQPPPFLSAVVLLSNPNSHNYAMGEVIIHISHATTWKCAHKDGIVGNQAPFSYSNAWRYATELEIRKAFA